jgi:histidinol-phosphate/aromatic aminotransferase/cobyric acid decarboxylase-like protein
MDGKVGRRAFLGAAAGSAAWLLAPGLARAQVSYGPAPGVIRLSSNENPYGPSEKALAAAAEAAARGAYYPGSVNRDLIAAIAERNALSADHVVTTSGSLETLHAAADAFSPYGRIVAPQLTFGPACANATC